MKRLLLLLLPACALAQSAGDVNLTRRNDTNTAYETVVLQPLPDFQDGIWALNGANGWPIYLKVGQNLGRDGNFLQVQGLTKSSVGLTNVDNTSDASKPISTAAQTALDAKANSSALSTVAFSGAYADLGGKPSLSSVATSGAYSDLTGKPTLGTASTQNSTAFATAAQGVKADGAEPAIAAGTTAQYYRGDKTWATMPAPGTGTVTSVIAGTGLSGGTITTSGTISLPNTGTAGTYSGVTTDAQGRVTAGTTRSFATPSRSIVTSTSATGWQVSATRGSFVSYEGTFQTTSAIGGPSSITVFLETADTNSTTPSDWTTIARQVNSNTITLAVVLQQVDIEPWSVSRFIPAGKYVRIRSGSVTGTATASINAEQQEVTQ